MTAASPQIHNQPDLPDPAVPDWEQMELPPAWVDSLDLRRIGDFFRFMKLVLGKRKQVQPET